MCCIDLYTYGIYIFFCEKEVYLQRICAFVYNFTLNRDI